MTTAAQWVAGARLRTLPAAVAPVLVGSGAARYEHGFVPGRAALALVVALALQVGVNYANDYSDGIRGTDKARVGPVRLVGQGLARPAQVLGAALLSFGIAGVAGLVLVALCGRWWLLLVGAACVAAAWFYTGGRRPYGYAGLGEVFVFVFFGLVAGAGTAYVQTTRLTATDVLAATAIGLPIVAILVANNLRDIPGDTTAGKRTLAVRLGDARTRALYLGLLIVMFATIVVIALTGPAWALIAFAAAPLVVPPVRAIRGGANGRDLIPVLVATGRLVLGVGVLLGVGLGTS